MGRPYVLDALFDKLRANGSKRPYVDRQTLDGVIISFADINI